MEENVKQQYFLSGKDLEIITKITNLLNEHVSIEDADGLGFYIHIDLRARDDNLIIGQWSDEFGEWLYEPRMDEIKS